MSLTFGASPWLLLLCVLGAAGAAYWSYRRTTPPLSRMRRLLLGGLRFGALFLVLFLLFRPVLRRVLETSTPPRVAVLIDGSQSLRLTTGDSLTPRAAIAGALRQLDDLRGNGDARFFAFGASLRALPEEPAAALDSLRFDAPRTDIAAALASARERLARENLSAIILLSDGQYNTGRNPLYVAGRLGVPVHTVALGDTLRRRDVQVRRITTNDLAYTGTTVPVRVSIRTDGFGGRSVQVTLLRSGERLASKQLTLPEGAAATPVTLAFTPEQAGRQRLTVRASRLDGEATYRNNAQTFTMRVLDSKRRVLLLAGAPSPGVGAFRRLLSEDSNTEVTTRIAQSGGGFYGGRLPDSLSSFDVLLLVGFPGPSTDAPTIRKVVQAAKNGTPLLFFLGPQTDLRALEEHFAGVLPVVPEAVRQSYVEAQPALTARAFRHPLFAGASEAAPWWRRLPPLSVNQSRWTVSPDAGVLARPVVRGTQLSAPLLVTRSRAGQRTLTFLGAGLWRWTNVPAELEGASEQWRNLFSNMLQWVSAPEAERLVRVSPARESFAGGASVRFTGQVYDESLTPVANASVKVTIIGPDSSENRYPHHMQALGNGRYTLDVGTLPEGTYRYRVEARRGETLLGTDRGAFAVGKLTLEYRATRANAALLRQIAARSGGTFYTAGEADQLSGRLMQAGAFAPVVTERERDIPLWHRYAFLIATIALLAAEWVLRKRSGMV